MKDLVQMAYLVIDTDAHMCTIDTLQPHLRARVQGAKNGVIYRLRVITMITMGLWHGLSQRYIVYGIYHGILMCINDVLTR